MTNETNILENESSHEMTVGNASTIYLVESFLSENYAFRRNLLSGKTEFAILNDKDDIPQNDETQCVETEEYTPLKDSAEVVWKVFTKECLNSIVRRAKKLGIGGKSSPRKDI